MKIILNSTRPRVITYTNAVVVVVVVVVVAATLVTTLSVTQLSIHSTYSFGTGSRSFTTYLYL